MNTSEKSKCAIAVSGSMTAKLSAPDQGTHDFEATFVDAYKLGNDLHLWGHQGDVEGQFDGIFLIIPLDTEEGNHIILPGEDDGQSRGIRAAFFNGSGEGFSTNEGSLKNLKWGEGKQSVEFTFDFEVETWLRAWSVCDGRLNVCYDIQKNLKEGSALPSSVLADVRPEIFPGHGQLESTWVTFRDTGSGYYMLHAWQAIDDLNQVGQGVIMYIDSNDPEALRPAIFTKDRGAYPARKYSLTNVEWDKQGRTFKADFEFDFNYSSQVVHTLRNGKIDLNY